MIKNILVCGDLHGQYNTLKKALKEFKYGNYDLLIQLGGLVNTENSEDLLNITKTVIDAKKEFGDKYIQLLGHSEIQYLHYPDLKNILENRKTHKIISQIFRVYKNYFKVAHSIGNRLFTSTGLNTKWFDKYYKVLLYYSYYIGKDISKPENLGEILNIIENSKDFHILHEVGYRFGGLKNDYGGITAGNKEELLDYSPIPGYFQIIGHGFTQEYHQINRFNGLSEENTKVLFCDILETEDRFLTLKI